MPKYSIEEVLDIIKTFTPEEKEALKAKLPAVLGTQTSSGTSSTQSQENSVSGVSFGSGSSAFNFAPVQAGGDATSSTSITQPANQNADLQEALRLLIQLRQGITQDDTLAPLVKAGAAAQVERVGKELEKQEPDKDLVAHTIATLKKGLEGVQTLAGPTIAVASLVAKAWGIPVP